MRQSPALTIVDLPAEILAVIVVDADPAAVFALKYTNKYLHSAIPTPAISADELMIASAIEGNLPAIQWLHSLNFMSYSVNSPRRCGAAARNGHHHILMWLVKNGYRIDKRVVIDAAFSGSIEMFEILKRLGYTPNNETISIAAALGHVDLIEWICNLNCIYIHANRLIHIAAAAGQTKVLEWLPYEKVEHNWSIVGIAAYNGHLDTVRWLLEKGYDRYTAMQYAIQGEQHVVRDWIESHYTFLSKPTGHVHIPASHDMKSCHFILNKYKWIP